MVQNEFFYKAALKHKEGTATSVSEKEEMSNIPREELIS